MHQRGDFSGQASPSYESYPPVSAYSSAPSTYFGVQNMPYDIQKGNMGRPVRRQTPSGSPSPSISQAFDHPPSILSSASGASAQSTASSTDGSPYASATHVLPYEDKWSGPFHGLGIAPDIVSNENFSQDSFPSTNFENDLMLEDSKFPNFVGECEHDFLPSSPLSQPFASSLRSGLASQNLVIAPCPWPSGLDTTTVNKEASIDSILQEANRKIQQPVQLISPVTAASPTSFTSKHQTTSPTERETLFRAPLTLLSAASRFASRASSPHGSGDRVSLGSPVISSVDLGAPRSPQHSPEQCHPCNRSTPPPVSRYQTRYGQSQSPLFGQSSGRFVAPLESSCRFSLLSPFPLKKILAIPFDPFSIQFNVRPLITDTSDLRRSFSHSTIRHTRCSH